MSLTSKTERAVNSIPPIHKEKQMIQFIIKESMQLKNFILRTFACEEKGIEENFNNLKISYQLRTKLQNLYEIPLPFDRYLKIYV